MWNGEIVLKNHRTAKFPSSVPARPARQAVPRRGRHKEKRTAQAVPSEGFSPSTGDAPSPTFRQARQKPKTCPTWTAHCIPASTHTSLPSRLSMRSMRWVMEVLRGSLGLGGQGSAEDRGDNADEAEDRGEAVSDECGHGVSPCVDASWFRFPAAAVSCQPLSEVSSSPPSGETVINTRRDESARIETSGEEKVLIPRWVTGDFRKTPYKSQ